MMKQIRVVAPFVLLSIPVALVAVASACGGYESTGDGAGGAGTGTGGGGPTGGGGNPTTACTPTVQQLPSDVLTAQADPKIQVATAHSTVRVVVRGYAGPLYQVCKGVSTPGPSSCQGETLDIGATSDCYADAAAQDAFCADTICTVSMIYDQSGNGNHLEPAPGGGAKPTPDTPSRAADLPITAGGHSVYGILIRPGNGYRTGCNGCNIKTGIGTALADEPQTVYMVTSSEDLRDGCCFDYGNAETTSNDDGNGTMEAVYFGGGVVWGTGAGGLGAKPGPWVMADLENGLFPGWEEGTWEDISTNTALFHDFVTALILGDTRDKNGGAGRFAVYGGDATTGVLKEMYDGIRPEKEGYVPMQKQGSLILGTGGDNSSIGGGRFYEGIMANGVATLETVNALQAAIIAAGYGK